VVFQNAPQSAQMLITGEVQLGTGQIDAFLLAFRKGARDLAVIAAPADRPDWFINVRPEIKSVADLRTKFLATASLQTGETWLAAKWLNGQGLGPQDFGFLVVGTTALKFAALQRGSVAAAIMFQPLALEAQLGGYPTIYRFLDGKPIPPVLYVVNRQWAAQKERGARLSRAIVLAHAWLLDPANRNEAIAILQKYTKRETKVMEAVYDLFIAKDKLYTADAAVDPAGVDAEIATMIEKGVLPPGTTMSPRDYMLPRELGGLYR
jgi:ABC-type nitrate/sulfonate/bicarbonate transport system substrate-binding protein